MARVTEFLHRSLWLAYVALGVMGIGFLLLLLDREPPFAIKEMQRINVQAGQWVFLKVPVWRDPERKCSAKYSRFIIDVENGRFDLGQQHASASFIQRLERDDPGMLNIKFLMPPIKSEEHKQGIAPGPASLVTSLSYVCNKAQVLWPLDMETDIPLWVSP